MPFPTLMVEQGEVRFTVTAEANPNNTTPATQGVMLRATLTPDAVIRAELGGQQVAIPATRLFEGAKSGNLGPIDTPAWRFHQLPAANEWQWQGEIPLGALEPGETFYREAAPIKRPDGVGLAIFVRMRFAMQQRAAVTNPREDKRMKLLKHFA